MRALPPLDVARCGVVTGTELAGAGWTPEAVRHAVRTGRLERITPGRFAPPPPADVDRFRRADIRLLRRSIAATLPADRNAVSHLGAALHRGWPVWAADAHPCVTTWDPAVRAVTGVHLHRVTNLGCLVRRGSLAVTSGPRTVTDIAREFGTETALVSGDVALRRGQITRDQLADEVDRSAGLPGIDEARRVGALLDPLAESPLESRSRWHFDANGIDQPRSQVLIHTHGGVFLARVDHFWEEGVVGEADGALKYRNPRDPWALEKEKNRQQALEDLELEVVRWSARDFTDFTAATTRIQRARRRARVRREQGDPLWFAVPTGPVGVRIPGAAEV